MSLLPIFIFISFNGVLSFSQETDDLRRSSSKPNYRSTESVHDVITASPCSGNNPCLRKCCPAGQVMDNQMNRTCVNESNDRFSVLDVWPAPDNNETAQGLIWEKFSEKFDLIYGNPCDQAFHLEPHLRDDDKFHLFSSNGSLYSPYFFAPLQTDKFCLETYADLNLTLPLICYSPSEIVSKVNTLYPISLMISIPFLIITFLVFAVIKELRSAHHRSLMSHVAALLVGYVFLVLIQLFHYSDFNPRFCVLAAVTVQFSFLAAFFWLNVMCFDLWLTFSGYRSFNGSIRERETKKFVTYSIYAWGCPALITGFALAVENLPSLAEYFPKPDFGERSCWFSETRALFYYFYGPMSLVLILNILMFVRTTVIIIRHKRDGKVLKRNGSQRHCSESEQQRFVVYLKLFIVMGVNWTMEVISWIFDGYDYLWCISDICNALQGVLIFMIFVCKRRVLRLLNQKLYPKKQFFPMPHHRSSSRSTSISSVGSTRMNNKNSIRVHMTDTQQYNDGDFQA